MAVNTILMDFSVKSSKLQNDEQEEVLTKVLENFFPQLNKVYKRLMEDGGYMLLFTALRGSFISVRAFPQGLLTINIEYYKNDLEEDLVSFQVCIQSKSNLYLILEYGIIVIRCYNCVIQVH